MTTMTPSSGLTSKQSVMRLLSLLRRRLQAAAPLAFALLGGFAIGGLIILASGESPLRAYAALLRGAVADPYNLATTVVRALPIIGTGIAAAVALKAGLWNIGAEAQMLLGALGLVLVNRYLPASFASLPLSLLVAMLFGGICALMIGWFQTAFRVPILLSSLLMNYLTAPLVSYLIGFPLREPGSNLNQTPMIPQVARLARLFPRTTLHAGLFIIAGVILVATFVMRRTVGGYEARMFGANPEFAVVGGVNPVRLTLIVMLCSGMIAGLTGGIQVAGVHYRLIDGSLTLPGYAWTGLMSAILSNNNPLGVVVGGLFFAAVQTGASGMERATKVPFELSYILQALMILLIGSRETLTYVQSRRKYEA